MEEQHRRRRDFKQKGTERSLEGQHMRRRDFWQVPLNNANMYKSKNVTKRIVVGTQRTPSTQGVCAN